MAQPQRPRRSPSRSAARTPRLRFLLLKPAVILFLLLLCLHLTTFVLPRANSFGRRCLPDPRAPLPPLPHLRMAIVSLSDNSEGPQRSFRGLMPLVALNKEAYARRWGYRFVDAGGSIDPRRPASWSKILAVRRYLDGYDWVFWNDADSIVTNPDISLERILQSALGQRDLNNSPDLVVTEDVNGINAGMWFLRRSRWSINFLERWWNQSHFVQLGSTRSGDNAALIHLIASMSPLQRKMHVHVAPLQCMFNSYPWMPTWKNGYRLLASPRAMWTGVYSRGDFMAHLAGVDDKMQWTARILQDLQDANSPVYP